MKVEIKNGWVKLPIEIGQKVWIYRGYKWEGKTKVPILDSDIIEELVLTQDGEWRVRFSNSIFTNTSFDSKDIRWFDSKQKAMDYYEKLFEEENRRGRSLK